MGGVRTRDILCVLLVALTISLPLNAIANDVPNVEILSDFEVESWYNEGDTIDFNSWLYNAGEQVTIDNDPTCGIVLVVKNSDNVIVFNGQEVCRNQNRELSLDSGESSDSYPLSWNFTQNGEFVESGMYLVEAIHTKTGLSLSFEVNFFSSVVLPEGLDLNLEIVNSSPDFSDAVAKTARLTWTNFANSPVSMPPDLFCKFVISVGGEERLGPNCFDEQGLEGLETRLHSVINLDYDIQSRTEIIISTPNQEWSESFSLTPQQSFSNQLTASFNGINLFEQITQDSQFTPSILLKNNGMEDIDFTFTNSCRAIYWVYDAIGNEIFDSQIFSSCSQMELERTIPSQNEISLQMPQWSYSDSNGCKIGSGEYILVASIPELGLTLTESFTYERNFAEACGNDEMITMQTSFYQSENRLGIELDLSSKSDTYLTWQGPCAVELILRDSDNQNIMTRQAVCDTYDGRSFFLQDGSAFSLSTEELMMIDEQGNNLADGQYSLEMNLATRTVNQQITEFNWPIQTEEREPVQETGETESNSQEFIGTWTGFLTQEGTCWVLTEQNGNQISLVSALGLVSWEPMQGQSGIYLGNIVEDSSIPCSNYQIQGLELTEIIHIYESVEVVEDEEVSEEEPVIQISEAIQTSNIPVQVVAILASTTILSLLATALISNESIRIPSTALGLWMIGLIGKTSETTDGRYQRGRIMGYLTANPGCHFRALMAAMQMSNGQCTHHIRILEKEEKIWRKKDGRLVRYYPLTAEMNPHTETQELPVPPLSPDPKSLQGKILTILDDDGMMGEFPTQAALAKRLDKSQQLISHHLRTLQKYGLVERRKMGVKNCYKLTREAVFLLETDEKFGR